MKKITFFKTLLLAAGLLGGSCAWATTTKTLYPTGSTDPTSVSSWSYYSTQMTANQGSGYISISSSGNGTRVAYLPFYVTGSDFYSDYDSYTVSFDFYTTEGWANASGSSSPEILMYAEGATISTPLYYTFTSKNTSAKNYLYNMTGTGTYNLLTMSVNGGTSVTYSNTTWYTASITVSKNSSQYDVAWSVKTQDGNTIMTSGTTTDVTSDGTSYKCQGVMLCLGKSCKEVRIANVKVTTEVDEEVVSDPTISAPEYAGANRTVTITSGTSSESNSVTTYYTTNGDDPTAESSVYSSALTITEDCTVKAISISSEGTASNISSRAITVGKLQLNAPTFAMTAYADGNYSVTISDSQSDLDFVPASTTIKYTIGAGDEQTYSGSAISVPAGSTVTAHVEATDYTNSSNAEWETAVQPNLPLSWSQNFAGVVESTLQIQKTSEGVYSNCIESNISGYYVPSSDGTTALTDKNIGFQISYSSSSSRKWNLYAASIYNAGSGTGTMVVTSLKAGQIVKVSWYNNASYASFSYSSSNLTKLNNISYGTVGYFEVKSDGQADFYVGRAGGVYYVEVYDVTVSATIGAAGYASFSSTYPLDLENISGATAYMVTENAANGYVTLTEATGTVAANTGLIIKGDAGTVTIPVAASGTDYSATNKLVTMTTTGNVAAGNYILAANKDGSEAGFYLLDEATSLDAGKAYLPASAVSEARARFLFSDDATAIKSIATNAADNAVIYNVAGQRVNAAYKGIVIKNGKKYLNK